VQYGDNAKQSYTWSTEGDLNSLAQDFNGTANDVSFTDTFNPAHQLATATITNPLFKFTPAASGTDSYGAVNVLNQYPTVTPAGSGAQTIAYDNNGNLTGDGTWTFVYDPENRLMTANKTGTAAAYAYDPLGRRTKKTVNSTSTFFLQDGDDEVGEYTAAGAIQRRFVLGDMIDQPIAMIDYTIAGNPKTYFHTDRQGSVIAMTNSSGNLAEGPYKYDGYGNGAPTTGVPFKFTGRRLDPETGLYYYRARYYSASLGRFLQVDPVGYTDDLDVYKYTGNDPINHADPSGRTAIYSGFGSSPSFDPPFFGQVDPTVT
jgi:RHS repeat-associated protein